MLSTIIYFIKGGRKPAFCFGIFVLDMIYNTQIEEKIYNLCHLALGDMGYEIARIRVLSGRDGKILQLMIEKQGGEQVNIKDCESVSKHVSVVLDVEDPISGEYNLEVSSTGFDKPLTRLKDFIAAIGKKVKLTTKMPINLQRNFTGIVLGVEGEDVIMENLQDKETPHVIPFKHMIDAELRYFDSQQQEKKNKNIKKGAKKS